jgi:hypothetical protein
MKVITKDINFLSKRNNSSLSKYKECLDKYSKNFEKELTLKTKTPIFLDTNVLLRYYSISFTAREKLFDFVKENSKRIILSPQVQYEFLKNREDVIQRFFEQVTNKIPKDYSSDVVNRMKNFLEVHKVVLKDYPFVETGILKHQTELEKLLTKLNETVDQKRNEHNDLIINDKFLDLLSTCILYDGLIEEEIDIVKKDFDTLAKGISTENLESLINKPNIVFPGLGDLKNKPENPYGDYLIFHEMMKYIVTHKVDMVFLTFDTAKGDWMGKLKSPHLHYVQNMYANTNQLLYILDGERTLGEILNVNIESLVSPESLAKIPLTLESLNNLLATYPLFKGTRPIIKPNVIEELNLVGYNFVNEVERDLNRGVDATILYQKSNGIKLAPIGILRVCLRIVNPNYTFFINDHGQIEELSGGTVLKYAKYRHLVIN